MAANGMERVLERVLKGKESDPPGSGPDPTIPGRDYVAADGTMLKGYFGDTEDEPMEQDDPVEHGSAEDLLSRRQGVSVAVCAPPPKGVDELDKEEEDLRPKAAPICTEHLKERLARLARVVMNRMHMNRK